MWTAPRGKCWLMWENCDLFCLTLRNDQYTSNTLHLLFFSHPGLKTSLSMQRRCEASIECWVLLSHHQTIFSVLVSCWRNLKRFAVAFNSLIYGTRHLQKQFEYKFVSTFFKNRLKLTRCQWKCMGCEMWTRLISPEGQQDSGVQTSIILNMHFH